MISVSKETLKELQHYAASQQASAYRAWISNHERKLGETARLKCAEWACAVQWLDAEIQRLDKQKILSE